MCFYTTRGSDINEWLGCRGSFCLEECLSEMMVKDADGKGGMRKR